MSLSINRQLSELGASGIRRFNQMARETPGCISLTLGEPGEDTPEEISSLVSRDLSSGMTHYPPNNGYPFLRQAIAAHEVERGVPARLAAADNVIVTVGATEALHVAINLLVNPGDEVIVPVPAFSLYESVATLARARVRRLDTVPTGFQIRRDSLEGVISPATKAIVITSPNNPTGCVLDAESLDCVAEAALEHGFYVICDDVYEELVYSGAYQCMAERHPELADRMIVVNSFSKPWAMTGWRLGWLSMDSPLAAEAAKVHQFAVSSVPAFLQHAAETALATDVSAMRESYQRRRNLTIEAIRLAGLSVFEPEGAFYAFPDVRSLGASSEELCRRAISEAGVALVPGTCFGSEGFVRISYATDEKTLEEGLARLVGFVRGLRG